MIKKMGAATFVQFCGLFKAKFNLQTKVAAVVQRFADISSSVFM